MGALHQQGFAACTLQDVHVVREGSVWPGKLCSAFVKMSSDSQVMEAVQKLHDTTIPALSSRRLVVEKAIPRVKTLSMNLPYADTSSSTSSEVAIRNQATESADDSISTSGGIASAVQRFIKIKEEKKETARLQSEKNPAIEYNTDDSNSTSSGISCALQHFIKVKKEDKLFHKRQREWDAERESEESKEENETPWQARLRKRKAAGLDS